mgnify:FL=1
MPNKHAAVKDLRKNRKQATRNSRLKTHIKALTTKVAGFLKEGKQEEAMILAQSLQQAVDKAAKKNVFHPNRSGRRVSSLHRSLTQKIA